MKAKVRLPEYIKPERYKIKLKPDLEGFTFSGEETIFLSLEKAVKEITLHSVDLEIESAELVHDNKETWAAKTTYNPKSETAAFTFFKKLPVGKGELKLKFTGLLNDKMRGFYRSKYEHDGKEKHLATTQFESTDARRAFPCFDEPSKKAIFDVILIVPKHTTAISNTIESNILEHESGYKIIEFAPTPKMSTYLLAFIVGEFEYVQGESLDSARDKSVKGKAVRVFTTPGKKKQAKFALDVAIKCLDFYENYFNIPFPLPVLDMIAIPDFAAGAMENWGAVTYRESTLLIDDETSSTANKQWVALVIAHELAHQWFGNLVTMEWWTHLWLNEGFASFIEYLAIDHIFPQWDIWTQFVATELSDAFSLDALENTHPIEVKVGHPAEISEIFDKVSYSKGASILRMLWKYLGEKDFQKGLQHYLKKHAYKNTQTEDLWKVLEEVSKKPVTKVMKNWTGKAGHPVVRLQATGYRLQLTQSRFFSSPISKKETTDNTVWSIPLKMLLRAQAKQSSSELDPTKITTRPLASRNDKTLLMDKKMITIPVPGNGWVKFNAGESSLVRINYPYEQLKKLEQAVINGQLEAPDRLGLIRDAFSFAQSGDLPTTSALELAKSYINEQDYTVWAELTQHLSQLDCLLAYEDFYPKFKKYGQSIYENIAGTMGWEKRSGEKHTDPLLRSMVLYKLGHFGHQKTIQKAKELFGSFVILGTNGVKTPESTDSGRARSSLARMTGNSIDPDLRGVIYNLVAENGSLEDFNKLIKMYKEEQNQQEKDRIGRSLGLFQSKTILQKALTFSLSKNVRFQNSLQIIAAVWGNPKGRYLAWDFVKKNWDLLKERYAGGHYFTRVFGPASEFTKTSDAKEIERFVKINPVPEATRAIAQALEQIYSNSEWLKRDKEKIKKFLIESMPEKS